MSGDDKAWRHTEAPGIHVGVDGLPVPGRTDKDFVL
jgi:hypothetical protein